MGRTALRVITPNVTRTLVTATVNLFTTVPTMVTCGHLGRHMGGLRLGCSGFVRRFATVLRHRTFAIDRDGGKWTVTETHKQNHHSLGSRVGVMPLLSMLLILLLVFVTATPVVARDIRISLPSTARSRTIDDGSGPPIVIRISNVNRCAIIIRGSHLRHLPPRRIITRISDHFGTGPGAIFLVNNTGSIPCSRVVGTLGLLRDTNIGSINLVARPVWASTFPLLRERQMANRRFLRARDIGNGQAGQRTRTNSGCFDDTTYRLVYNTSLRFIQ